jgi:predicted metal-dependent hydrolase
VKPEKTKLVIGDLHLDVVRKKIKNLHLSVHPPNGKVRVAAPLRLNDDAIRLFVVSKIGWIKKHQLRFESQDLPSKREYVSGESHYFFGDRYLLNVVYHDSKPRLEIRDKTYIDLYVRMGSNEAQREKVLTEWYRDQLKAQIPSFVDKWTSILGVQLKEWRIKMMRTRWGSCSRKTKRIWVNLELARRPIHCLEFVIVHELTHLLERRHNDRFKTLMDGFMPQWRAIKREINELMIHR